MEEAVHRTERETRFVEDLRGTLQTHSADVRPFRSPGGGGAGNRTRVEIT
jgi:hypothetical protein